MTFIVTLIAGYAGLCGYLYFNQRHLIYIAPRSVPGAPPVDSVYRLLEVDEPGVGRLTDWIAPPTNRSEPTIIFFHGNGCDRRDFAALGERFHQRGWGVVLASYRGYEGNPGTPTEAGLMADARATLAALKPLHGPVIVWGHSLGSGVAARMASEGRASGLILEAPYTSLTDMAKLRYPEVPVRWLLSDTFDTASLVPLIKVPVLIFHGIDDPEIPVSMGRKLARLWGAQARLIVVGGHVGHSPHHGTNDLSAIALRWANEEHIQ